MLLMSVILIGVACRPIVIMLAKLAQLSNFLIPTVDSLKTVTLLLLFLDIKMIDREIDQIFIDSFKYE